MHGREYYPNGSVRFEGTYKIQKAYGPNPPVFGSYYTESGELVYTGPFALKAGGEEAIVQL